MRSLLSPALLVALATFLAPGDAVAESPALSLNRTGQSIALSWPSSEGQIYRLERSPLEASSSWQALTEDMPSAGETMSYQADEPASRMFYRLAVQPDERPAIAKVAVMGDSLTRFTSGFDDFSQGLRMFNSRGYAAQARVLLDGKVDYVPWTAEGTESFARGGYTTQRIKDEILPSALASDADIIVWMCGTNDWLYGDDATYLSNWLTQIRSIALSIQAAGKQSVFVELPPTLSIFAPGPARIAAMWAAAPDALVGTGTIYCRSAADLELTPGSRNGIANPIYFEGGGVHFIDSGANLQGRAVRDTLRKSFQLKAAPFSGAGYTNVLANPQLTPNPTHIDRPDSWADPYIREGATMASSMHANGDGSFRYDVVYDQGTATGDSFVFANVDTTADLGGKNCDSIMEVEVLSGSFSRLTLDLFAYGSGESIAQDLYGTRDSGNVPVFTPADGRIIFHTPKVTSAAGVTQLLPVLRMIGTGTIAIHRAEVRTYP